MRKNNLTTPPEINPYELIKEIDADKAHYVTALLIRGGVFSQGKD